MTESNTIYPFSRGQFVCKDCHSLFYAERDLIVFEDGVYWAPCPSCGCTDGLETSYMRNLHKTIGTAKGANMSPEAREKTRLNGYTTGSSSALPWYKGRIPMAPAKPGKYFECDDCQDFEDCHHQVRVSRGTSFPVYCHRKVEVTLKYASAFLAADPEAMRLIAAENAAKMQQLYNASMKKIFDRGVEVIENEFKWDKNGSLCKDADGKVFTVEKIYAHPLIKRCIEIAQVMGFTLTDWTMTPKSKEAKERVSGFIAGMAVGSGKTVEAVSEDITKKVETFVDRLEKAKALRDQDKTLQVFDQEHGRREGHE